MNKMLGLIFVLLVSSVSSRHLRTIFDRVDAMEVPQDNPMQVHFIHIAPHNNSLFQATFEDTRDLVSSKLKIHIEVIRCLVGEAPDTCEYLINLKPPNACAFLNAENMAWNAFTDAFSPKLRCPLKNGTFVATEAGFDGNKWNIFPLERYYFKVLFKLYEKDVLLCGIIAETHFSPVF